MKPHVTQSTLNAVFIVRVLKSPLTSLLLSSFVFSFFSSPFSSRVSFRRFRFSDKRDLFLHDGYFAASYYYWKRRFSEESAIDWSSSVWLQACSVFVASRFSLWCCTRSVKLDGRKSWSLKLSGLIDHTQCNLKRFLLSALWNFSGNWELWFSQQRVRRWLSYGF